MGQSFTVHRKTHTEGLVSLRKWGRKVPFETVKDGSLGYVNGFPVAAHYDPCGLPTPWTPGVIRVTESAWDLTRDITLAHEWQHAMDGTMFWPTFMYFYNKRLRTLWLEARATIAASGMEDEGHPEHYVLDHIRLIALSTKSSMWDVENFVEQARGKVAPVTQINWK